MGRGGAGKRDSHGGGGGGQSSGKGGRGSAVGRQKGALVADLPGRLQESEVQLGEGSKDMILELIVRLMEARGDALPSGKSSKELRKQRESGASKDDAEEAAELEDAKMAAVMEAMRLPDEELAEAPELAPDAQGGATGAEGEEAEEDWEEDGGDEGAAQSPDTLAAKDSASRKASEGPEAAAGSGDKQSSERSSKEEERVKRRLMRQLLEEDRTEAAVGGGDAATALASGGDSKKRVPAQGNVVRLHLWNEDKMNEKPKGPLLLPRGGSEAVDELIKTAKAKLSLKGGAKKVYWAYVNGGLFGNDAKNARPTPLKDTFLLADGDCVILSSKPAPVEKEAAPKPTEGLAEGQRSAGSEKKASPKEAEKPQEQKEAAKPGQALDAVRAAYKSRTRRKGGRKRTEADAESESAALLERLRAWSSEAKWEQQRRVRAALPAAAVRAEFVRAVSSSQVVVVSGETGSGKTTQCPNFILEDFAERGKGGECTIICTQPRRLAAIGVAERVCYERGEEPGGPVGYAVRLESRSSSRTRLLFCTTGVLLQRLNDDPLLNDITHLIIDEAHERNLQTDFLLTILRDVLPRRPELRLVLMSATLERGLFVDYFSQRVGASSSKTSVPAVHIPGRTHPVEIRFLDEVEAAIKGRAVPRGRVSENDVGNGSSESSVAVDADLEAWILQNHGPGARTGSAQQVVISPAAEQKPDYRLLADLVASILKGDKGHDGLNARDDGAILVFLPGAMEIEKALSQIRNHPGVGSRAWLLPLHGQMPTHRQRQVFKHPPEDKRKVILSTNIAETSITVDDVTHVIDCGQVKESRYDPRSRMGVLATCFVSKAAAKQRAGRAGRVRPGVCWRLFRRDFFERQLPEHTLCEMRRTSLEELVLQLRLLELGDDPGEFLQRSPEPPSRASLDAALQTLVQIGALGPVSEGRPLTALGFHLAHMPMDVRTGKMLLYGALMRCLSPILTIAACLSHKSPFARGFGGKGREEHVRREKDHAFGSLRSDHLGVVEAFDGWRAAKGRGREAERSYCDKYSLSSSALESMASLRERFLEHLRDVQFVPRREASRDGEGARSREGNEEWDPDANAKDHALLRCVLCAGLYPNVAQVQRVSGSKGPAKVSLVSVGDLDRCVVHPGSLLSQRLSDVRANDAWLLYHTKVKTSQVFLHDATLIGSIPLLLFGGGDVQLALDRRTMIVDRKIRFDGGAERTAVLLKLLRREAERLLLLKIADPAADISRTAEPLLAAVGQLLRLEGARAGGLKSCAA